MALTYTPDEQPPVEFEGDYRPADPAANMPANVRVEATHADFLHRLADTLNATLDLQTAMHRVAELVRAVVEYRIFAILLLNDRTQELWMRFQVGHAPEIERKRIKMGQGISGQAAERRESIRVDDVAKTPNYINANPHVRSELAVPLVIKNKVIGVLDIESEQVAHFTHEHQKLLELVASRMAVAIENARLYTRVSRQAQTLVVLNEISRELISILDLDDLLERIGTLLKRVVDFQMFTILLWSESRQKFVHRFSTRFGERIVRERNTPLGVGIIGTAAKERTPVLAPDVRKDSRYVEDHPDVRSELAVPLLYKGTVIGVLDLEHTRVNYYNEEHQRTLETLAGQIAIAITNARLYERIFEEEQRMERDLTMAREVQIRLLPPKPPTVANAEVAAQFLPARSIGGDLYDFIPYGDGRLAIVLGDVSGKAAPAALYAALVSGILRSLAVQQLSPAAMLAAMNNQLQQRRLDAQYVTMLIAVWDGTNRTLQVANAGSVQPLLVTGDADDRHASTINAEGFPLGLFPDAEYEQFTFATQPGDQIVFFSDGITDAENAQKEMFGSERLCEFLQAQYGSTVHETLDRTLFAISQFQAGAEHFDDETLLILQVHVAVGYDRSCMPHANQNSVQTILPARSLRGSVRLPGDKSISHRYAMLAGLAEGTSHFTNFSSGADPHSSLACMEALGAKVEKRADGTIAVTGTAGNFRQPSVDLDCGNSGSTMRMLSGLIAPHPHTFTLVGDHSLTLRPMERIRKPLAQMGARINLTDGHAPITIHGGPLQAISFDTPIPSAQVKTAILFAGLQANGTTTISESVRTRDHSEHALRAFGAELTRSADSISISGGQTLRAMDATVPGDMSSAAFFLCAALLFPDSNLVLDDLGMNPTRAALLDVLSAIGLRIKVLNLEEQHGEMIGTLQVNSSPLLRGTEISGALSAQLIDELPVIAAIAPFTRDGIRIRDAKELRVKESDRIALTAQNLRAMGAEVVEHEDGLDVPGGQTLRGGMCDSGTDHRIAMAFSIAALRAQGETQIHGADAAAISFPEFYTLLDSLCER